MKVVEKESCEIQKGVEDLHFDLLWRNNKLKLKQKQMTTRRGAVFRFAGQLLKKNWPSRSNIKKVQFKTQNCSIKYFGQFWSTYVPNYLIKKNNSYFSI